MEVDRGEEIPEELLEEVELMVFTDVAVANEFMVDEDMDGMLYFSKLEWSDAGLWC